MERHAPRVITLHPDEICSDGIKNTHELCSLPLRIGRETSTGACFLPPVPQLIPTRWMIRNGTTLAIRSGVRYQRHAGMAQGSQRARHLEAHCLLSRVEKLPPGVKDT